MTLTLAARWIFPVASPPIRDGLLVLDGERIVSVGPCAGQRIDHDLGDVAVIPGLVNAHTHLDLTGMLGVAPPRLPLPDWLSEVIEYRRKMPPEATLAAIRIGLDECIGTGTTLVGDIAGGGMSWPILNTSGIRATMYYELIGLSSERAGAAWEAFERWESRLETIPELQSCWLGLSPHAPYSASHMGLYFEGSVEGCLVATHLAESREEIDLLSRREGPFVEFLKRLGVWHPEQLAESVEEVLRVLSLSNASVIAHGNYLSPDAPIPANATIVYCPRTHAAFGHDPHPWREFLARGVRVALGTDSLASNPDLDLLAEARFLRERFPDVSGATLLHMATLAGAEALGWGEITGSLMPGKSADLAVIPLDGSTGGDPHELVLSSAAPVVKVMCRGRWLV